DNTPICFTAYMDDKHFTHVLASRGTESIGAAVSDQMMTVLQWQGLDRLTISVWVPVESRCGHYSTSGAALLSTLHGEHDEYM
ncbi:hypothetical protein KI387_008996, partial [Taxus chinensis]